MKNLVLSMAVILGTSSALAGTQAARVCSVGRQGQVYTTQFRVEGSRAIMIVDGDPLEYNVDSMKSAELSRASAIAGEKVVEATQYVLSSPQGATVLQIAVGASRAQYMIFPQEGILGATSSNCH